jgi:hypothetical protein
VRRIRRRRPRPVGPYLAEVDRELAAAGVGFSPPHAIPYEGSDILGVVDARVVVPGVPGAVIRAFELIDMTRGDDPRVTYSYRLVIDERQVLGWDRDGVTPDHGHVWDADNRTIDHPPGTISRAAFLAAVVEQLGAGPRR